MAFSVKASPTQAAIGSTTGSEYRDRYFQGNEGEYRTMLTESCTLYIGNMSFFTSEDQIYELFGMCGEVKRVIMGLDRNERTPCGFCFVEYYMHEAAKKAVVCISGTKLDDRVIRADWDAGFLEGRQYGRGKSGGQVRDEFRDDYDEERGGAGSKSRERTDRGMDFNRRKRHFN